MEGQRRARPAKRRETLAAGSSESAREVSGVSKGTEEEQEACMAAPHCNTPH